MDEKTVNVSNISCGHCVATIEREVGEMPGVTSVDADETTKRVTVRWEAPASWDQIAATLDEIGFPADAAS